MTHQERTEILEKAKDKKKESEALTKAKKTQNKIEQKGKYFVVPNLKPRTEVFVPKGENPVKVFQRVRIQREVQKHYR